MYFQYIFQRVLTKNVLQVHVVYNRRIDMKFHFQIQVTFIAFRRKISKATTETNENNKQTQQDKSEST